MPENGVKNNNNAQIYQRDILLNTPTMKKIIEEFKTRGQGLTISDNFIEESEFAHKQHGLDTLDYEQPSVVYDWLKSVIEYINNPKVSLMHGDQVRAVVKDLGRHGYSVDALQSSTNPDIVKIVPMLHDLEQYGFFATDYAMNLQKNGMITDEEIKETMSTMQIRNSEDSSKLDSVEVDPEAFSYGFHAEASAVESGIPMPGLTPDPKLDKVESPFVEPIPTNAMNSATEVPPMPGLTPDPKLDKVESPFVEPIPTNAMNSATEVPPMPRPTPDPKLDKVESPFVEPIPINAMNSVTEVPPMPRPTPDPKSDPVAVETGYPTGVIKIKRESTEEIVDLLDRMISLKTDRKQDVICELEGQVLTTENCENYADVLIKNNDVFFNILRKDRETLLNTSEMQAVILNFHHRNRDVIPTQADDLVEKNFENVMKKITSLDYNQPFEILAWLNEIKTYINNPNFPIEQDRVIVDNILDLLNKTGYMEEPSEVKTIEDNCRRMIAFSLEDLKNYGFFAYDYANDLRDMKNYQENVGLDQNIKTVVDDNNNVSKTIKLTLTEGQTIDDIMPTMLEVKNSQQKEVECAFGNYILSTDGCSNLDELAAKKEALLQEGFKQDVLTDVKKPKSIEEMNEELEKIQEQMNAVSVFPEVRALKESIKDRPSKPKFETKDVALQSINSSFQEMANFKLEEIKSDKFPFDNPKEVYKWILSTAPYVNNEDFYFPVSVVLQRLRESGYTTEYFPVTTENDYYVRLIAYLMKDLEINKCLTLEYARSVIPDVILNKRLQDVIDRHKQTRNNTVDTSGDIVQLTVKENESIMDLLGRMLEIKRQENKEVECWYNGYFFTTVGCNSILELQMRHANAILDKYEEDKEAILRLPEMQKAIETFKTPISEATDFNSELQLQAIRKITEIDDKEKVNLENSEEVYDWLVSTIPYINDPEVFFPIETVIEKLEFHGYNDKNLDVKTQDDYYQRLVSSQISDLKQYHFLIQPYAEKLMEEGLISQQDITNSVSSFHYYSKEMISLNEQRKKIEAKLYYISQMENGYVSFENPRKQIPGFSERIAELEGKIAELEAMPKKPVVNYDEFFMESNKKLYSKLAENIPTSDINNVMSKYCAAIAQPTAENMSLALSALGLIADTQEEKPLLVDAIVSMIYKNSNQITEEELTTLEEQMSTFHLPVLEKNDEIDVQINQLRTEIESIHQEQSRIVESQIPAREQLQQELVGIDNQIAEIRKEQKLNLQSNPVGETEIDNSDILDTSFPPITPSSITSVHRASSNLISKIRNSAFAKKVKEILKKMSAGHIACLVLTVANVASIAVPAYIHAKQEGISLETGTTVESQVENNNLDIETPLQDVAQNMVDTVINQDNIREQIQNTLNQAIEAGVQIGTQTPENESMDISTDGFVNTSQEVLPSITEEGQFIQSVNDTLKNVQLGEAKRYSSADRAAQDIDGGITKAKGSWENATPSGYYAYDNKTLEQIDLKQATDIWQNGGQVVMGVENNGTTIGFVPVGQQDENTSGMSR